MQSRRLLVTAFIVLATAVTAYSSPVDDGATGGFVGQGVRSSSLLVVQLVLMLGARWLMVSSGRSLWR